MSYEVAQTLGAGHRKQKQLADEIEILERYERQAKVPGPLPARLAKRLAGLRAKAGKSP